MKHKKLLVILSCLILACNTEHKEDVADNVIYFDTKKSIEEYDMKDLTDGTFSIIPLETTDECLVAKIDKIEIKDNRIYIMDKTAHSVYVFDMDGKYLNKIYKRGQGPEEYTNLSYMTVTDSSVIILDHLAERQLEYRIPSMEFINKGKDSFENFWATDIFYLNGVVYYINDWSNSNAGKFRLFSQKHGTENFEKYLPFEEEPLSLGINRPTYAINGNEASLIYSGCDTIFRISDGKVLPEYIMKFKNKVKYSSGKVENIYKDNPAGRVIGINGINESDKYLFIEISMTTKENKPVGPGNYGAYICIHNKSDHSTIICPDNVIYNSIFDDAYAIGRIIDNKIIFWCDAYALPFLYPPKLAERTFKKEEYGGRLKNVIENLTQDGNPVLFIYGLK
jgi:hypothetical protein